MQPLIGITGDREQNRHGQQVTELNDAYSRAVAAAGGVPVLIPSLLEGTQRRSLIERLDGVLFSGGGDIEPSRYGSAHTGRLIAVHPDRDELELELLPLALEAQKPVLGICRGCQLFNVALGGTLFPDLAQNPGGSIKHDQPGSERALLVHEVALEGDSELRRILGETTVAVNSHHHQGLDRVSPRLRVAGRAQDGLVEAVELPEHPFAVAVQWHPEWLTDQQATRNLFQRFVDAAASSR